jgi:acetyltransferase-like isoleucine patch superfamily enzyme/dTDP-4-dehydrorhamnose 3,5-epimerase-like enzyme
MDYFRHEHALVETTAVGRGTRIWAFAHVLPGARLGADCNICDHVFIENDVVVGDRVTVKPGVQLWDGVTIEDDVFIGPNATFTNDPFPRSKHPPARFSRTIVRRGASIGANATILPGLVVGEKAMVGAGCVVERDVPANAVVVGNPARITGYVDAANERASLRPAFPAEPGIVETAVRGVTLHRLKRVDDLRGTLVVGEINREVPFEVKRCFVVFDVADREIRGEHAHLTLHQLLVCLRGRVHVMVDDGTARAEFVLDSPSLGVHVPPRVWSSTFRYSPDALVLVLASDFYRPEDYVRSYGDFLEVVGRRRDPAE